MSEQEIIEQPTSYTNITTRELESYLHDSSFINSFKEFDPIEQMEPYKNSTVILFGMRGKGKTQILNYYLYQVHKWYKDNCQVHVFSDTAYMQPGMFKYIVPQTNIHHDYDIEFIKNIVDEQEELVLNYITKNKKPKVDDGCPFLMLIFDDFIGRRDIVQSSIFNNLFTNSRHKNIVVFCLAQTLASLTGLPRVIKSNADLVISFQIEDFVQREIAVESWLSLENKKIGHIILKALTYQQYEAIAICLRNHKQKYQDYVFRYKAPEKIPDFHIGTPVLNPLSQPTRLKFIKPVDEHKFKLVLQPEKEKIISDYFDASTLNTSQIQARNKTTAKVKLIKPKKKK